MKARNRIALGAALAAAAALAAWALRPQAVDVETATVRRGVFEQTVSDDGKTRVRDRYAVSAPLAGRLERILLKAGDPVNEGQVVAVLRPSAPAFLDARTERELEERIGAADAQQRRAAAETQRAEAQLAQARADRDRAAKLSEQSYVSAAAREQAELAVRAAEKALEAAAYTEHASGHDRDQARAALSRYRAESTGRASRGGRWEVKAPVRGFVLKVVQESEGAVALGMPLLEIADPRSLEAVVDVLSQDSVAIRPGMSARLDIGAGVPPLAARVRLVEPSAFTKISALGIEEQRVNVVLDFIEPLDRVHTIGDGFRVDAHIVTYRDGNALTVPVGAVFREGGSWAVFAVADGRAIKRAVKVTRWNSAHALIEAGLDLDERVVVYPPDSLRDGARVTVRAAPAGSQAGSG
jgi:HlyD family secretion protein